MQAYAPRVPRVCQTCGAGFVLIGVQALRKAGLFCSRDCYYAAKRLTFEQFDAKLDKSGECWLWPGTTQNQGYGVVGRRKFKDDPDDLHLAHHVAWEFAFGAVPDGLWVLHQCDVRRCCRPSHLFLGTRTDNIRDMFAKGRGRPGGYAQKR